MENKKEIKVSDKELFDTPEFESYLNVLQELRKDGENKVLALKNEIRDYKLNKQLDKETKRKLIARDKELIKQAKVVEKENKERVKVLIKEASLKAEEIGKAAYLEAKVIKNEKVLAAKEEYKETVEKEKTDHIQRLASIKPLDANATKEERNAYKIDVRAEKILHSSKLNEAKAKYKERVDKAKTKLYDCYLNKYNYLGRVRNSHHSLLEALEFKAKTYVYSFVFKDFIIRNALYFIIIAFFVACVIKSEGNLLTEGNIRGILSQSSTKMFFSLGVAGLILIGGTDLSIGRMTGMAASFACMLLSNNKYFDNFGGSIDILNLGWPARIIITLLLCIFVCVLFSSIAGFFTAKFKMHPFITTLSTQLLIFGIMMVLYNNNPAFNINLDIKKLINGDNNINLIIYAIIAIIVVWFIWNKTKFGKYMYAVGGNAEAASVSGISVFRVTLLIFVMAGVLYGFGGFLEGSRVGSANPNTAFGTELDAIAACVIGGISFSGGVGKIKGAVLGTIIFAGMTYCLTNLGFDVNIQYIFKGIIIMAAVCLDSIKYLKKK
jgi:methyl-galactoside transport system permease protein